MHSNFGPAHVTKSDLAWLHLFPHQLNEKVWGQGESSMNKRTYCICRGPRSVSNTHVRWLRTTCNPSFRGSDAVFQTLQVPAFTYTQMHIYTDKLKNKVFRKQKRLLLLLCIKHLAQFNCLRKMSYLTV